MKHEKRSPRIVRICWGRMQIEGMNKQLQIHPGIRGYLEERSIAVQVAESREAVKNYNDLAEGAPVAGLFPSTWQCIRCLRPSSRSP